MHHEAALPTLHILPKTWRTSRRPWSKTKKAKERQKKYKDQKMYMGEHKIKLGDQVLLERKSTKSNSPYDPDPYTVSQTHGTQIIANRGSKSKTRDAQKWRKVKVVQRRDYDAIRGGQMNHNREKD